MKQTNFIIISIIFLLFSQNCIRKPSPCPTCNGTGKITQSRNENLPHKVIDFKVVDKGFFNPDYYAKVTIENLGDEDGTFRIFVDFDYHGIGKHTEEGNIFVKAHSRNTTEIRYDADKRADECYCRVVAPVVVVTDKSICPTCGGSGLVQ